MPRKKKLHLPMDEMLKAIVDAGTPAAPPRMRTVVVTLTKLGTYECEVTDHAGTADTIVVHPKEDAEFPTDRTSSDAFTRAASLALKKWR